jgi:DNA polymerase I
VPSLYLIDAHAYLHRAYHALPPLTTSQGQPVNAVYGFIRMILKIERQYKPDYIAVCFDTAAPTFRHQAFEAYKATRREIDEALVSQFPLAVEAVEALNLAGYEKDGFEADDLISHFTREARKKDWDVVIVSGDKDALQLVGEGVKVLNESKDILYGSDEVRARYGVSPEQIPEVFALMGDTSDNVPGVRGIGEKTAVKLIQEHGTLEDLLKAAPKLKGKVGELLKEHAEEARQSRALVRLDQDVPITIDWEKCRRTEPKVDVLLPFLQKVEFQALLKDLVPAAAISVDTSKRDYGTLLTEGDLKDWVAKAARADKLALDTETTGLDSLTTKLVGISLSYQKGTACYIPLGHQVLGGPAQLSIEVVRKALSALLVGDQPRLYGHNLKFDVQVLESHGIPVGKLACDTMVASYVLNPSRNNHGLKDLALDLLGEQMTPIDQLIGKGAKQISMDAVAVEEAAPYACADADMTLRLAEKLEPMLKEKGLEPLFYEMEMPLVKILSDMERVGTRIDRPYLEALGRDLRAQAEKIEQEIYKIAGETFNVNSPKQLSTVLFEKLKLPVIRRTKTGISTDEEVLQKLSEQHPLPKRLMDYRELQKMISTYVEGLLAAARGPEDRIHTSFNQTVAATGRLSSSNPNLQNIPIRTELGRRIRKAFIPKAGWTFLSADYSQIDLRMLAHISEDKALCEAFQNGEDIHTATACEIFGITAKEMTPEVRRVAKSINFGIVYGISAFGLAQQLGIPVEEAQSHINRYFERYPGVKAWIEKTLAEARRDGYVRTLLGRIRYLPEIQSTNGSMRGFAERVAMNTPIQGTSADVIKLAMIKLAQARVPDRPLPSRERVPSPDLRLPSPGKGEGWAGHMLVQVHDELLFEIPPEDLPRSQSKIKELMETAIPLRIPVIVDLKVGHNWAEMTPTS